MAHGKQKQGPAIDMRALQQDAVSALTAYASWAKAASDSGRVTPVQFLAVVLWALEALQGRELTEQEQVVALSAWWGKLVNATAQRVATLGGVAASRYVVPLDMLTFLELDELKVSTLEGWCLSTHNLDSWLDALGHGAWCNWFFESCGVRGVVTDLPTVQAANTAPGTAFGASDTKNVRVRVAGTSWTGEQETQLQLDFKNASGKSDAAKHKAVAVLWGIESGSVKKQLSAIEKKAKDAGAMGKMANNLSGNR